MILHFIEIGPALSDADLVRIRAMLSKVPQRTNLEIVLAAVTASASMIAESGARAPWCGYLCVLPNSESAGTCSFTSAPENGVVEIKFATFPIHEGRGVATQMVRQLVELARASGIVKNLVAYTSSEQDASTSALQTNGFMRESTFDMNLRGVRWRKRLDADGL